MKGLTLEDIRERGLILYEVISGSRAYGTDLPTSDTDLRGVFILPADDLFGMKYTEQINNDSNDIIFYELKRFLQLVSTNNPNILELLNVPEDCVVYKHPLFDEILKHRDSFITTACRNSFGGYAVEQIKKARGLNKKIVKSFEKERKTPLDFCYVPHGQGSIPIKEWLAARNFTPENCGLVSIPHMRDTYHLFVSPNKYRGIISGPDANDVCLSETAKEDKPLTTMFFNKDGYTIYCKDYKQYWEWVEKRNPDRYNENVAHGKGYDGKNLMHCHRLLDMCIEIATEGKINVRRPNREHLLLIRKGEYEYDKLIEEAEAKIKIVDDLFSNSSLPDHVDDVFVNNLLVDFRKKFYLLTKTYTT